MCGLAGRLGDSKTIGSVRNVPPFKQRQREIVLAGVPGATGAVFFVVIFVTLAEREEKKLCRKSGPRNCGSGRYRMERMETYANSVTTQPQQQTRMELARKYNSSCGSRSLAWSWSKREHNNYKSRKDWRGRLFTVLCTLFTTWLRVECRGSPVVVVGFNESSREITHDEGTVESNIFLHFLRKQTMIGCVTITD